MSLVEAGLKLPEKVAIVMGREADGVSKQLLEASQKYETVYVSGGVAAAARLWVALSMQLFA